MYLLCFYCPKDSADAVKAAMFAAGAGNIGDYQHCSWQVEGQGQFEPLANAKPAIGEINQLEKLAEYKIEMVVAKEKVKAVVMAMLEAHPYEEPAYHLLETKTLEDF
jgi:hypothetical protein